MPKSAWDLLLEALEDLSAEQFKKFTEKLIDSRMEPRVRRGAVEGKDRGDVARKLIDTYTEKRALLIAVELLEKIGCNQIAEDLKKEAAENGFSVTPAPGGSAETSSSTSASGGSAEASSSASAYEATFIDDHWVQLVQRTTGVEAILDVLLSKKVINNEQYNDIRANSTDQKKMRELVLGPINSSGQSGKEVLYKVLMNQQPYMMKDLGAR